jgi:ankyrin repeat protein
MELYRGRMDRRFRNVLLIGVLAFGSAAAAQATVYKCVAKDGSTTYSDVPCDQNAQVMDIPPDPWHSNAATAQPRVSGSSPGQPPHLTPALVAAARQQSAREASAMTCSDQAFNAWIAAQPRPLPDPNVRIAKLVELSNQCRRIFRLPPMIPPARIPPPPPVEGGAAGAAAAGNLAQLVKSGSVSRLLKYLATPGVDINARPGTDEALLDYAAEQNQAAIARVLIEHGANVNAVQHQGPNAGYSALHRAAIADAAEVATLLLADGAEVNIHGPLGVTPLILAASNGSRRTVEVLLNHGADILTPDGHLQTAISLASAHNHPDIVEQLLIHLPAPTKYSMDNAAMRGDLANLSLMLRHDRLVHDTSGATKDEALRFAILGGPNPLPVREQMIVLLLADGADVDNRYPGSEVIPVMLAPSPEIAELLFAHGANRKAGLSGAQLAQWFVCNNSSRNPLGLVQVLVARGIDIRGNSPSGQSALPCAEHANNFQLVAYLRAHEVGAGRPGEIAPAPAPRTRDAAQSAIEAELHPKRPCVRLDEIRTSPTPMELYGAVRDCLQNNRDADAVALFALAGLDSSFDAMRVTDKTGGQARQILIMDLLQGMSPELRARFQYAMRNEVSDAQRHATLCGQVERIGPPRYFPAYMVNHGIRAIQSALANQPRSAPLEPNFNAADSWKSLLTSYLSCSALPELPN